MLHLEYIMHTASTDAFCLDEWLEILNAGPAILMPASLVCTTYTCVYMLLILCLWILELCYNLNSILSNDHLCSNWQHSEKLGLQVTLHVLVIMLASHLNSLFIIPILTNDLTVFLLLIAFVYISDYGNERCAQRSSTFVG